MCDIGQRIKHLRNSHDLSQTQLAELLGYKNYTTVTKWEKGENLPRGKELKMMAEYFKVSTDYILGLTNGILPNKEESDLLSIYTQLEQPRQHNVYTYAEAQLNEQNTVQEEISVYGGVAANPTELTYGDPIYDEKITTDVPKEADGAVTIHGDSMEDFLYDGDIAFFKRQPDVENGEIAIVEIDGSGVTCKKVVKEDGKIILRSLNKKYDDRVIEKEKVRIIGKVVK